MITKCPLCGEPTYTRNGYIYCTESPDMCGWAIVEADSTLFYPVKKVRLQFMVDPQALAERTYVENPVKIKVIRPDLIFLEGILGDSGKKMVAAGFPFIFERPLAEDLISRGIAEEIK